jgi:hypothetical protein
MCIFCNKNKNIEEYLERNNGSILIDNCEKIIEIPKIGNRIYNLIIRDCKNLSNISVISQLKSLYILNCNKLRKIDKIEKLERVHIENCGALENIEKLSGINYYSINDNNMIEAQFTIINCGSILNIPYLSNFRRLVIDKCVNLKNIEPTSSIYDISISSCKYIKDISRFINLVHINIFKTPIKFIPFYENLRTLSIHTNNHIRTISHYPNLINLSINFCNNIQQIASLPKLRKSNIIGCENIKYIHSLPKIHLLDISYSDSLDKLELPNTVLFYTLSYKFQIYHRFVGKQYPRDGYGLTKNMYKLIKLQQFIKKYLFYKKFITYINSRGFNEWFYHPNGIGGRSHIKRFYNMFQKI